MTVITGLDRTVIGSMDGKVNIYNNRTVKVSMDILCEVTANTKNCVQMINYSTKSTYENNEARAA